jgi:hypothetical protein
MPVPGVILAANDANQTALIRVRIEGQLQEVVVSYGEIEVRSC